MLCLPPSILSKVISLLNVFKGTFVVIIKLLMVEFIPTCHTFPANPTAIAIATDTAGLLHLYHLSSFIVLQLVYTKESSFMYVLHVI